MRKPIHLPLGRGLCVLWYLSFVFPTSPLSAQACFTITNCPQGAPVYCDSTSNDINFWNAPPFTFAPSIGTTDMPETAVPGMSVRAKGCNGGELTSVSFLLFLDLDNDDFLETVINSENPPPPGRIMANNSFNPGFSGGDTVWFDNRALPDSLLYRFALEVNYAGDTTIGWVRFNTDADPYVYLPVVLPEGKHRVEWTAEQDGIERYCDRNFTVKDCAAPVVHCKPGLAVYLDISQSATLHLADALLNFSDNLTPDTQMVLGLRRAGTGQGMPYGANGLPQDTAMFNCTMNENQFIELWAQDKCGNLSHCIQEVLVYDTAGFCPLGLASTVCATTYWNNEVVQDVDFRFSWLGPNQQPVSSTLQNLGGGCTILNDFPPANQFSLSANKNTDVTNGITTYDLVLISKHILALDPFTDGWKLMAADVNQSHSVTTFDILEIRKLILGLSDKLPGSTPSWRFFVDTCHVWGSPFFGTCPSAYDLPKLPVTNYPPDLSFRAVKMGDVNGSASSVDTLQSGLNSRTEPMYWTTPEKALAPGEVYDIPFYSSETGLIDGFQCSFPFASSVQVLEVLPTAHLPIETEHWSVGRGGQLHLSWSGQEPVWVVKGKPVFYVRVRAQDQALVSESLADLAAAGLTPEVYPQDQGIRPLAVAVRNTAPDANLSPWPNPTSGGVVWPLELSATMPVQLELLDGNGRIQWNITQQFSAGMHQLALPAEALPGPGVYWWRIRMGDELVHGKLVRI
ncbi:MAG: hypothetical protein J0M29_16335 [Chitinophagales bacterium]|nr:hypothetical protein [Chitinophagales bacterium]